MLLAVIAYLCPPPLYIPPKTYPTRLEVEFEPRKMTILRDIVFDGFFIYIIATSHS